jgi:hypothetical protein
MDPISILVQFTVALQLLKVIPDVAFPIKKFEKQDAVTGTFVVPI